MPIDDAVTGDGNGPGTLAASQDDSVIVPHTAHLPLVILRAESPRGARLCALAGGRGTGDNGCASPPSLPAPRPPSGSPEDHEPDTTLSPNGLGWLRLGRPLPAPVERLPAYSAGPCAVRALPGRGAAVISHGDRVESIALFSTLYVPEDAGYRAEVELATDRGITPSAAATAPEAYGKPDEVLAGMMRWQLPRTDGGQSVFSASRDYDNTAPMTMSTEGAQCEIWE
jgi:hypothetical protein